MDDIKLALLGDKEAAKRLTEQGVLLGCPGCGGDNPVERYVCGDHFVICKTCGWMGPEKNTPEAARRRERKVMQTVAEHILSLSYG